MKRLVLDVSCYAYLIIVVLQKYLIIVACDHGVAVYVKHFKPCMACSICPVCIM